MHGPAVRALLLYRQHEDSHFLFAGRPLRHTPARAWHRDGAKLTTLEAPADAKDIATFTLPLAGPWMITTVHMIPATDAPEPDWEGFWGSLTFDPGTLTAAR